MNVEGILFQVENNRLMSRSKVVIHQAIHLVQDSREGSMGATVVGTNITLEKYKPTFYLDNTVTFHKYVILLNITFIWY